MTMWSSRGKCGPALDRLYVEQAPTLPFTSKPENVLAGTHNSANRSSSVSCSLSRRGALQERLDGVEREVEAYMKLVRSEDARFNRESYLWTAEDRIEWQEARLSNAERLDELLRERRDLQSASEREETFQALGRDPARKAPMRNIKEVVLRAMPQMLFFVGYAAIFLAAVHLYVLLTSGARSE